MQRLPRVLGCRLGGLWLGVTVAIAIAWPVDAGASGVPMQAAAAPPAKSAGAEIARSISLITGVAISPLLGVSAVGAWQYFKTPGDRRAQLPWYARPWFWIPALLLVGFVALKDILGTTLPPGLKKPVDVAETIENKVSGLVAAGAFVPLAAAIFASGTGGDPQSFLQCVPGGAGLAAIHFGSLLNVILVPFALVAFVLVWLACHAINILILLSPFGVVDAALKSLRIFLMSLVTGTTFVNPYVGAIISLGMILVAYFLAGWAFRLSICGTVYVWDFVTRRRKRFQPAPDANWMFTARELDRVPIRTYGRLRRGNEGRFVFEYRPWLFLPSRTLPLPADRYAVGRGLFYPEVMTLNPEGEKDQSVFILPPRYRTHEAELARAYGLGEVVDVGILRGLKAMWRWLKALFGFHTKARTIPATT